ncbi:ribonuclease P protein component [Mycoplasma tauri]|uniref:Ribonuclease P protein component n=1 Tax=Mycoplasma tauri TaxID=547987 RepID=A0A953ND80_9MOLU|nr:ribonuclease P protein component [Mycoplasma tauri]MBZ4195349.1 ribonuclease P protein component [Mycoplasma tauri]MBZ4203592.1 ribonuclease P protein component [Mycoplasma tauri]MBZ4203998.1 ribonuclease P protein component [Mycoplasma tauri]MBZ4212786.1 ribonuclease P protein component [Mycoplasma tauri]MBZ4218316.1 ribonuclease P protein component [Mycoplasma tauri]
MKKIYRLRKSQDFDEIIKSKKQISNNFLVLYYARADNFKLGITIPKKFCNAVLRNYYKRQVKAIVHSLNIYDLNFHCVLILRKSFLKNNFETKQESVNKIFKKLVNTINKEVKDDRI